MLVYLYRGGTLQQGVVAQVSSLLGDVSPDETRTDVVHDLLEAGRRDGGCQHVQDNPTGGADLVVDLLVLREEGVTVMLSVTWSVTCSLTLSVQGCLHEVSRTENRLQFKRGKFYLE